MKTLEVFRVGTHTSLAGEKITFTAAMLAAAAKAYNPKLHKAPMVIGHPATDDPAWGWIKSLTFSNLVCESFSDGPAKWLTELNFPGAATPRVTRVFEDEEDLSEAAARDKILYEIGFERSEESINETYGDHYSRRAAEATGGACVEAQASDSAVKSAAAAAGKPKDAMEAAVDEELGDWERFLAPVAGDLEKIARESATLEEFRERLGEAVMGADDTVMETLLARMTFSARTAGRVGVDMAPDPAESEPDSGKE